MKKYPDKYNITYELLLLFLEEVQTSNGKLKTAQKYSNNVSDLIETIKNLQPYIIYTNTKANLTKLINKLNEQLDIESEEQTF